MFSSPRGPLRVQTKGAVIEGEWHLTAGEDIVVDVSVICDFHGDMMRDVRRNGTLCWHPSSSALLVQTKSKKIEIKK